LKDQDGEVRAAVQEALTSLANVKGFGKTAEGLSSPARAISLPGPRYPADALAAHLGGTVYLEFLVKTDGSVTNVRVLKSVPGLDDAAVEAAAHFIFAPPVKDGRLVETPAQAPIHFRVDSPPTGFEKP
jgi:TonB family protein